MPSSFTSPTPGSAIWRDGALECRATGRAVLSDFRAGLIWESLGSKTIDEEAELVQAAVDSAGANGWSVAALTALVSLLTRYGHTTFASAVRTDAARGGALSRTSMQAVLWAAYGHERRVTTAADGSRTYANRHEGSPSAFTLPTDVQLPVVGSLAPMPLDGITAGSSCRPAPAPGPGTGDLSVRGVAETSPLLVVVLIAAFAATGLTLMTFARKKSERW